MRLVHLVPSSGEAFYCENCVRDQLVSSALREAGQELTVVPLYLPLADLQTGQADAPIFLGGINTWLREHVAPFRHSPRWLESLLDHQRLLRVVASRAGSTSARGLGPMTASMLLGERGPHRREVLRLADWLAASARPQVVHLSNALLLGLARAIKERTGAAVVCTLQDELPWVEGMEGDWPSTVWQAMAAQVGSVDAFVSVSASYGHRVAGRLGLEPERIEVIPIGLDVGAYPPAAPAEGPPVLGYLARASASEGLGQLVEAFLGLRAERGHGDLQLQVLGGRTDEDRDFLAGLRRRLEGAGAAERVVFFQDFGAEARRALLSSWSLFSVPGATGSAFGINVLEALASGLPVVLPRAGAVQELVQTTGGGLLYPPEDSDGLVDALDALLRDPERRARMGARGRAGVMRHYASDTMSERLLDLFRRVAP